MKNNDIDYLEEQELSSAIESKDIRCGYYYSSPLFDTNEYVGFSAGESHRNIIEAAGGEIGYDGFKDPRPDSTGKIVANEFFINQTTGDINGINFYKDGEFVCSYEGLNYEDIKDSNKKDCENKESEEY